MANREYSSKVQEILKAAKQQALSANHKYVDLHHLLYAMIYTASSSTYKILVSIGCDIPLLKKKLNSSFFNEKNIDLSNYSNNHIPLSENADLVLRESIEEAKILGYNKADDRHLFLALIKTGKKDINQLLDVFSIDYNLILSFVPKKNTQKINKNQMTILIHKLNDF